jgi:hypothetical protein
MRLRNRVKSGNFAATLPDGVCLNESKDYFSFDLTAAVFEILK